MRIALVSPDSVFRAGFRSLLEGTPDLRLVAEAPDARSGFALVDREKPDLVAIAVVLPGMNGIAAAEEIKRRLPSTHVLLLAGWTRERDLLDGLAAGAEGLAVTTDAPETLLGAIRTVGSGQRYLPPEARGVMTGPPRRGDHTQSDVLAVLSRREREVLDLIVRGRHSRDIARELCVSIKTIETHRSHINRKLHTASSADLVRFFADNDLWPRPPGRRGGPDRTVAVFFEGSTRECRDELLHELRADGATASLRLERHQPAELGGTYGSLLDENGEPGVPRLVLFDEPGPAVRAVALLAGAEMTRLFFQAVDRVRAHQRASLVRGLA